MPSGPARARYPYDDAVASMAGRPAGVWMRPTLGFFQLGRQATVTVHPAAWRSVPRWAIWTPRDGLVPPVGLPGARPADLLTAAGLLGADSAQDSARDSARDSAKDAIRDSARDSSAASVASADSASVSADSAAASAVDSAVDSALDSALDSGAGTALPEREAAQRSQRLRDRLRDGRGDAITLLRDVLDLLDLPGAPLLSGDLDITDLPGARLVEPAARHARAFDRLVSEEARYRIEMEA